MEKFVIEQNYDLAALTALSRAARKTVQKKKKIARAFWWGFLAVSAGLCALLIALGGAPNFWVWASLALVLLFLLLEDRLNAWITLKQMFPGAARSMTTFTDEGYEVTTDTTETKYQYGSVTDLCEMERYFIFFLGARHGQIFDKQLFRQGEPEAFRAWIEQATGKTFQKCK